MTLKAENLSKRYMRKTGQANYFYAVRGASLEDLQKAPGVSAAVAQAVHDFYHAGR